MSSPAVLAAHAAVCAARDITEAAREAFNIAMEVQREAGRALLAAIAIERSACDAIARPDTVRDTQLSGGESTDEEEREFRAFRGEPVALPPPIGCSTRNWRKRQRAEKRAEEAVAAAERAYNCGRRKLATRKYCPPNIQRDNQRYARERARTIRKEEADRVDQIAVDRLLTVVQ